MNRILTITISLLFYGTLAAQVKDQVPVDTLLSIPLSRAQYCLAKIEQVNVLTERVLVKDQQLELANERMGNKEKERSLWEEQYNSASTQRDINQQKLNEKEKLLTDFQAKVKSLKKQNAGLKIGGVILIVLALLI